jgi:hypothetical protein
MRPVLLAAALLTASTAFQAAQSAPPSAQTARPPQIASSSVPFGVGETLTYDVRYASYLVAGSAVARVQEKRSSPGTSPYYIVAEGKPIPMLATLYRMYYRMDTLLDSVTLLPHRTSVHTEEGSRKRSTQTLFDRTTGKGVIDVQADTTSRVEFDVPPQVQDGLSALYVLRAMTFKTGDRITLPVADDGLIYSTRVEVVGSERVTVPFGAMDASVLRLSITDPDGRPAATNTAIWISTDARRLPVKIQTELPIGTFVLMLRQTSP